ncbi:DNA primase [Stigmatella sp. ncwal1]|uniref:DNA primase n=1 Tax=Stigmatella ashevillensis TaxID=2995309 RepID=A0ABT5D8H0_9BACT|nr:DNA primase [Stigmatella ashevillena]MDC0709344.1 DNA primase [Stigmatella ashevillena]
MIIPEHKIEEIIDRVDLTGLISRYVELKKSGREYKGRCPFHQEKTPSFYVIPEKRFYFCHGCRASGDAVSFVQRYLGKPFIEAVKDLAREVGVDLEAAQDPTARERQQLKEVTDLAAEHFRSLLWQDEGRAARAYLATRGVSEETAQAFGLGWAAQSWSLLADKLTRAGMVEWAVKAGLVQRRQNADGYYDFFRSRLMVPIRAPEGRPIAFGGRLVGADEGPKYLNSKESRLYNKSDILYGMDQARDEVRRRKSAILVEGYFDCIGLHQVGVRHAVALCSTALTPGHLQLLHRGEARDLVLLLDGDQAGLSAVERLAGPLLAAGAATRVALLPQGDDPDTFARREGVEGVERLLQGAQPLTAHLFASVLPQGARASFEEKMTAIERLKPMAAQIPVGLVRSAFLNAVGAHFSLPVGDLEGALRPKAPQKPAPFPSQTPGPAAPAAPRTPPARPPDALEAFYVAAALRDPRLVARDTFRACDELSHTGLRMVLAHATSGQGTEDALFEAPETVKRALEGALRQLPEPGAPLEQAFLAVCRKLMLRRIDEQLGYIEKATKQAPGAYDLTEETRRLLGERIELLALKKRVLDELRPAPTGTKAPMQPV